MTTSRDRWRTRLWWVAGTAGAALVAILFWAVKPHRAPLADLYTPRFGEVAPAAGPTETVSRLVAELRTPRGGRFLEKMAPSDAGAIWLAIVVVVVVGSRAAAASSRRLDLALLLLPGILLFRALDLLSMLDRPVYVRLLDWVFSGVVAAHLALIARALWRATHPPRLGWRPALPTGLLAGVAMTLVALDVVTTLARPADDAGVYINVGAQRLRERGRLPYGDPLLDGTPAAAYGPLLYVAHVPFQWLIDPRVPNVNSPDRPELGEHSSYLAPSELATKLCTLAFHLVGVFALWSVGRRLAGIEVAWALVALYAGSIAVLGAGGDTDKVTGLSFVSHIAPASVVVAAVALAEWPALAGVVLAAAAGLAFYPAFMAPAFAGYYWSARRRFWRFGVGFLAAGVGIVVVTLALSRAEPGLTKIQTFLIDTFGHHTDPHGYGRSPFGFWGQRGPIRTRMVSPLVGDSGITSPALLALLGCSLSMFAVTRRRPVPALALACGSVATAAMLVKVHATGTYLEWAYPLLLLGHLAWRPEGGEAVS